MQSQLHALAGLQRLVEDLECRDWEECDLGTIGVVIIALYVAVLLGVGWWSMRKTRSVGDFFLGGRAIGTWMSAFAYGTTYFSAVLFIGYGGKLGWGYGIHTMWIVAGNVLVGSLLAWLVLAKRTREMTSRLGAMTMPAFLAERYKSPALKVAAAALIFVFLVPYSASVYMGLSYLIEKAIGVSQGQALVFLAALTGVYLVLGGYLAVTLTDFIMGIVMIFGAGALVVCVTGPMGGIVETTRLLLNTDVCSPALKPGPPGSIPGWLTLVSLVVVTSFGPWGLPQMVQKFYSVKSGAHAKRATIVATLFALIVTFGGYYAGAVTHLNVPKSPTAIIKNLPDVSEGQYTSPKELPVKTDRQGKPVILPNGKPDVDWDRWVPTFLGQRLPGWVMFLIVLLVLSASMSTLSSLVLVSSSAIAMDLYAGVIKPNVERRSVLILMRVLCAVFVLASLLIALKPPSYIINLMVISWGVLAGAFAAPYIYGLFWRRANAFGAGVAMFTGVAVGVVLYQQLGLPGVPVAGAVAMLLPLAVMPVATLVTGPMAKEDVARAFTASSDQP